MSVELTCSFPSLLLHRSFLKKLVSDWLIFSPQGGSLIVVTSCTVFVRIWAASYLISLNTLECMPSGSADCCPLIDQRVPGIRASRAQIEHFEWGGWGRCTGQQESGGGGGGTGLLGHLDALVMLPSSSSPSSCVRSLSCSLSSLEQWPLALASEGDGCSHLAGQQNGLQGLPLAQPEESKQAIKRARGQVDWFALPGCNWQVGGGQPHSHLANSRHCGGCVCLDTPLHPALSHTEQPQH